MRTAIVLPSAVEIVQRYGDHRYSSRSYVSIACWDAVVFGGCRQRLVGHQSFLALEEAFGILSLKCETIDTLTRGGIHDDRHDPLNGFVEYTGGMSYVVWHWSTVIEWLHKGWPKPTEKSTDSAAGLWCWYEQEERILPAFDANEKQQLLSVGVPEDVVNGDRLMTETEAADAAVRVLNTYRNKPKHRRHATR